MQLTLKLNKRTQCDKILDVLENGKWLPVYELVYKTRIMQYNARIKELKDEGYKIENKTEIVNGDKYSWYRLVKNG